MNSNLGLLSLDDLSIQVEQEQTPKSIIWRGVLDSKDPEEALLSFLVQTIQSIQTEPVSVDFRELNYVNSANIMSLIKFVTDLGAKGGVIVALFNGSVDWQRLTAQCMRVIVRSLKNVRVECT